MTSVYGMSGQLEEGWAVAAKIIKTVNRMSARRFEAATQDVVGVQTAKIMSMIETNAQTEYGRRYGFDKIRTIADYQERVPIITYEDIKADMQRVTEGAQNVFTAEDPSTAGETSVTILPL